MFTAAQAAQKLKGVMLARLMEFTAAQAAQKGNTFTRALPQHHALADARALMAGYRAWRAIMEKIWRIR